ncbi:hypothetical protein HOY82DRAFT_537166 [Tuber indicum]|nr:hypothetical protein HOY82DRAFT_537166 [Tuber indicum]
MPYPIRTADILRDDGTVDYLRIIQQYRTRSPKQWYDNKSSAYSHAHNNRYPNPTNPTNPLNPTYPTHHAPIYLAHREVFDIEGDPAYCSHFSNPRQPTFRNPQGFVRAAEPDRSFSRQLITIFTTSSSLFTYHHPNRPTAPIMSPCISCTRLKTLLRTFLEHLHLPLRHPTACAPVPEEHTQITYDPIEYSRHSNDSTGSDDIPWAEYVVTVTGATMSAEGGNERGG